MDAIFQFMQSGVSFIIPMVILLGLLIFVHELGHFLVAKYYNVRVEVFSLGFGPKLFKFKRGDTTYAISAIPLGGYVKMFGDDPTADIREEDKSKSFLHKPVGQRIAIVLAGPLMNLFFAILLFGMVALIGEQVLSPRVGDIEPGTYAYQSGFRSGDTVIEVNNQSIETWDQFQKAVEASGNQTLNVNVARAGSDEIVSISTEPKLVRNKNVLSWAREVGEVEGLTYSSRASVVGLATTSAPLVEAGMQTGDIITEINGKEISRWRDLENEIGGLMQAGTLDVKVMRGLGEKEPSNLEFKVAVPPEVQLLSGGEALRALGAEYPELYIGRVIEGSPAEKAGLKVGDKLISIGDVGIQRFEEVQGIIGSFNSDKGPLSLVVQRSGAGELHGGLHTVSVSPEMKEQMTPQGQQQERFAIGIVPMIVDAIPSTKIWRTNNPVEAAVKGVQQTAKWTDLTVLSFVRLFQGEVSSKNIGGVISIGQMAKKSWQIGAFQFLNIMAIISINLFILNLLPVPVLDGGHLVFFSIEALRGAPLSMRKLEIAQQVGLILLLSLMVFALFNDVTRIIGSAW